MFKQRLLTTLILVPLVLIAIYYANAASLAYLVLLVTAVLASEWAKLIPIKHRIGQYVFMAGVLLLVWPAKHWPNYWLIADLIFWVAILLAVLSFPRSQIVWGHRFVVGITCLLLLPLVPSAIFALYHQKQGKDLIVYLLCLIWSSDIGAYLAGKQWGCHKLIPTVSPGKTVEGSIGGIVLVLLVAWLGAFYFKPHDIIFWFVTALCTALISMLGDLFISMLKRRVHLKDTGNVFPGHGGVLDRLDSLIAALPLFYFAYTFNSISLGL